ncbi:MAG: hypothetical protein Q4C79_10795 [Neisseria sp.]|nr:hypothetical protein [Neisseria sp.]MDO4249419.1 hypothetical protein [Neisseria sp.]
MRNAQWLCFTSGNNVNNTGKKSKVDNSQFAADIEYQAPSGAEKIK